MTVHDGDGTRHVAHGARSTRRALSTRAVAAAWVTSPDRSAANPRPTQSAATVADPAPWTSAMLGTAARFSTSPARVTRWKTYAETGASTSSTARLPIEIRTAACHQARRPGRQPDA